MSPIILYSIISLSALGAVAALILYFVAQRFKVYEDPRIDKVEEALPSANCGGCGYPGCRNFAEAAVKADTLDDLYCPVGGNELMKEVAEILGKKAVEQEAKVAVLKCNGSHAHRPQISEYDGAGSCAIEHATFGNETGCSFGCLGHGDCVDACDFDAIHINMETGLPEVLDDKCTACGACVTACPKDIIELRPKQKKDRKVYVACSNTDPGAAVKKSCSTACIGCGLCVKECPFEAISMENNLAYIHPDKCTLCRLCVPVCPTNAILDIGFPKPAKPKKKKPAANKETAKQPKEKTGAKSAEKQAKPATGSADKQAPQANEPKNTDKPADDKPDSQNPPKGDNPDNETKN